ncbi:hypothetical protein HDU82_001328 [Entophlyctis luteolus]|nr:hypothetical protein HDU82_001328 [Entophlyctis luteolus]
MVNVVSVLAAVATAAASGACAFRLGTNGARNIIDSIQEEAPSGVAPKGLPLRSGLFNQTVDHFGNQQGVNGSWFYQPYFIQDKYYKPGGPIFFFLAGEGPEDGSWMTGGLGSIMSWVMPRYNGMGITLEHRFYGANADASNPSRSVPTVDLSPESLQLLTSEQAVEDNVNFIKQFASTFPEYNVTADTRFISIGGSYSGALSAWMREKHPEAVYAAHAASAPVLANWNFWRYSYAVDEGASFISNLYYGNGNSCMEGFTRAVQLLDTAVRELAAAGNATALSAFKDQFWMAGVPDNRDFTTAVTTNMAETVQYYPTASKLAGGQTYIDAVCGGKTIPAFTSGNATDAELLNALAEQWILQLQVDGFTGPDDPNIAAYFSTAAITDFSIDGGIAYQYLWAWQYCNQFGYGQVAQPLNGGLIESWSVYSQLNTVDYEQWQCQTYGLTTGPTDAQIAATNANYGGLNVPTSRIMWLNGQYDPWHWLSNYQSPPGADQVSFLYANASHCNDLWGPLNGTSHWPPVSKDYQWDLFQQIFAVYDEWVYGTSTTEASSSSTSAISGTTTAASESGVLATASQASAETYAQATVGTTTAPTAAGYIAPSGVLAGGVSAPAAVGLAGVFVLAMMI